MSRVERLAPPNAAPSSPTTKVCHKPGCGGLIPTEPGTHTCPTCGRVQRV